MTNDAPASDALNRLSAWLRQHHPRDLLMPLSRTKGASKQPAHSHKGDKWSWDQFDAALSKCAGRTPEVGLLLRDLCAVDVDDEATALQLEQMYPELARAPMETTRAGRHYLFLRPPYADAEGFFDGARQHGPTLAADFKSVCSTGTSGVLVVAPSSNKRWVRPPWGSAPFEMPRELLAYIAKGRSCAKPRTAVAAPVMHGDNRSSNSSNSNHGSGDMPPSFHAADPVIKLLNLLGKTRWDSYSDWFRIAVALKSAHGDKYRAAWLWFSEISTKFKLDEAEAQWRSTPCDASHDNAFTMCSIEGWARHDDPLGYQCYRASIVPALVKETWDQGDKALATIAHSLLHDTVKLVSSEKGLYYWFSQSDCAWRPCNQARVRLVVSDALEGVLRDVDMWHAGQVTQVTPPDQKKVVDEKRKKLAAAIANVCSYRGASAIASMASPMFEDAAFEQRLDSVRHLIGIADGKVVDLRSGEVRARRPEDMICVELKVQCAGTVVPPPPVWIEQLVTGMMAGDAELANWLQRCLGYGITGETCEEIFLVLTACGRNGKGVLQRRQSYSGQSA